MSVTMRFSGLLLVIIRTANTLLSFTVILPYR